MKAQCDEGGGRILLVDDTRGGESYYDRSGFGVFEFGIQLDCLLFTYI